MAEPFIARHPDDLPTRTRLLSMSGLDFMRGVLSGDITAPPISGCLNYRLDSVEEGRVRFRGTPEFAHLNPMGGVHGGWYGTLLDSAMACAVMTRVPKGSFYTTLEYKVNIIRAIPTGMEIVCDGLCQHAGRSTGVASGELRGAQDGRLYATGSTTCLIMSGA